MSNIKFFGIDPGHEPKAPAPNPAVAGGGQYEVATARPNTPPQRAEHAVVQVSAPVVTITADRMIVSGKVMGEA